MPKKCILFLVFVVVSIALLSFGCMKLGTGQNSESDDLEIEAPPLFASLTEISVEAYLEKYKDVDGNENPLVKNATRAAEVVLNENLLKQNALRVGDLFQVNLFENEPIGTLVIDYVDYQEMTTISGYLEGSSWNRFILSLAEGRTLASLELLENKIIYTLITNRQSNIIYLFETPRNLSGELECGGAVVPPGNEPDESGKKPDKEEGNKIVKINGPVGLIKKIDEISREKYMELYGVASLMDEPVSAVARRIGRIKLNADALKSGAIKTGDRIAFETFGGKKYVVLIKSIQGNDGLSFTGVIEKPHSGTLFFSYAGGKALGTMECPAENKLFLIKYNHASANHYLFEAAMDEIEKLPD